MGSLLRLFYLLSIFLILSACAGNKNDGDSEDVSTQEPQSFCTVSELDIGVQISCLDGTNVIVRHGTNGTDGKDGENGIDGKDGKDGSNGSSCTVTELENKTLIACEDGTEALIEDGEDGATGHSLVEVIDPCGPESRFDEVLLRFSNGDIVAHFASGDKQHFAILVPGTYRTTDGTNCQFRVTEDLQVESL